MLLLSWRDSQNFCDRIVQKRDFHLQLLLLEPPVGGMEPTACHKDMWFTVSRNTNDLQTPVLHSWAALPWKLWPKKNTQRELVQRQQGQVCDLQTAWFHSVCECAAFLSSQFGQQECVVFFTIIYTHVIPNFCTNVNNLEPKLTVQNQKGGFQIFIICENIHSIFCQEPFLRNNIRCHPSHEQVLQN